MFIVVIRGTLDFSMTSGLLGTWTNDTDDDFTTPDGYVLSPNATEREIFQNFGQLCE